MNLLKKVVDGTKESNAENNHEIVPSEIDKIQTNLKSLPNSSNFSISKHQMLGSLMNSRTSLKVIQDEFGQANILGFPIQLWGGARIKINDIVYDLTPEIYKASSSTSNTGKTMTNEEDILRMCNVIRELGNTGRGERQPSRKTFFTITLPKLVNDIQNKTFDEITDSSDDLQGEGVKIFIPSYMTDIYTRRKLLLGLKIIKPYRYSNRS